MFTNNICTLRIVFRQIQRWSWSRY